MFDKSIYKFILNDNSIKSTVNENLLKKYYIRDIWYQFYKLMPLTLVDLHYKGFFSYLKLAVFLSAYCELVIFSNLS